MSLQKKNAPVKLLIHTNFALNMDNMAYLFAMVIQQLTRKPKKPRLASIEAVGMIKVTSAIRGNLEVVGRIAGLNRGGSALIKHYALRLTLWLSGYTPFKFIKFLDHCAKLILLKKVGGYIFVHRMLLDYFAELPTQAASNKSASDRSDPG